MTFQEFQAQVKSLYSNTSPEEFRDFSPEFTEDHYPGRKRYEWQDGFYAIAYDTVDSKPWFASPGRGAHGWGNTLAKAMADEEKNYAPQ